jgi:phosphoglycolate phosphatase
MNNKLLIFDLDGTLIDSLSDLTDATNHMLGLFGRPALIESQVRLLVGQGARSLVARAMPDASVDEVERGLAAFLDYNEAHIADRTRPYPGVVATLERLRDGGCPLAIVSNKNVALCREVLAILGIGDFFAAVLGADSLPTRKPSPDPVLKLVHDFGVGPADAAMVGDSINDIAAGRGAGVVTVGCTWGYGDISELAEADFRIDTFAELTALPLFSKHEAIERG